MHRMWMSICMITVGAFAGCATAPIPSGQMATSAAAIRAAEEIGAAKNPRAALHLQLAKEESGQAKSIIDTHGDMDRAEGLLIRAEADAELARAIARNESARTDADQAVQRLDNLKVTK